VPDLTRLLLPDDSGEQAGAVAAVVGADLRACLSEPRFGHRDGQIAEDMENMTTAERVPSDHGDHRLGCPPDLDLEVEDVEPADPLVGDGVVAEIAVVTADSLVAAGAEGKLSRDGQ